MEGLPSATMLPCVLLLLMLSNASAHEGEDVLYPEGSCGASLHTCIDKFEEAFGGPGLIEELGMVSLVGDKSNFFGLAQFLPPPPGPLGPGGRPPLVGPGGLPPPGLPPPGGDGGGLPVDENGNPLALGGDGAGPPPGQPPFLPDGHGHQRRKRKVPQRKGHIQNLKNLIKSTSNLRTIPSRFRRNSPPNPNDPLANFTLTDFMMLDITNQWQQGIMVQEKTCQFLSTVDTVKFKSAHECAQARSVDETCAAEFIMLKDVLSQDPPEDMYKQVETKMCGPECAGAKAKLDSIVECTALPEGAASAAELLNTFLLRITSGQDYSQTCTDLRNILICPLKKMGCCQVLVDQLEIALSQQLPVQILELCNVKYDTGHCRQPDEEKNSNLIAAGSALQSSVVMLAVAALPLMLIW